MKWKGGGGGAAFTDYFEECSFFLSLGVRMDKSGPISYGRYTDVSTDDNFRCFTPKLLHSFIGNIPDQDKVCDLSPALPYCLLAERDDILQILLCYRICCIH